LNSSLVKFNFHEWGNVNSTRFLGRTFDDILLEFFYYQLEKKFISETKNNINRKHWLRLLIGNKNDHNECILRYFVRSSGAFTMLHRCNQGGHPACQCQPIPLIEVIPLPTVSNVTIEPVDDNCTNVTSDEDLINNETITEYIHDYNITLIKKPRSNYRLLLMFIIPPLLALVILSIGIVFLIRHIRRSRSYSTHSSRILSLRRTKRSSTAGTTDSTDTTNTPVVLYTRLKPSPVSIKIDTDITNDDNVQLLSQSTNQTSIHENIIAEDEEEPFYATLKPPDKK
jgi:hypothetical protein